MAIDSFADVTTLNCGIAKVPAPDGKLHPGFPFLRFLTFVYLPVFTVWALTMVLGDRWALFIPNGFMSLIMAAGSFVAGSTSLGGGAVAFPVMTLAFDVDLVVARDFSLVVQSVGMMAATAAICDDAGSGGEEGTAMGRRGRPAGPAARLRGAFPAPGGSHGQDPVRRRGVQLRPDAVVDKLARQPLPSDRHLPLRLGGRTGALRSGIGGRDRYPGVLAPGAAIRCLREGGYPDLGHPDGDQCLGRYALGERHRRPGPGGLGLLVGVRARGGVRRTVRGLVHKPLAPAVYRAAYLRPDGCAVCQYLAHPAPDTDPGGLEYPGDRLQPFAVPPVPPSYKAHRTGFGSPR